MDINNINNKAAREITESAKTDPRSRTGEAGQKPDASTPAQPDRVTLEQFDTSKTERLFARIELEKLNHGSLDRVREMKQQIDDLEAARENPDSAPEKTELGKKLNDPEVMGRIAERILGL